MSGSQKTSTATVSGCSSSTGTNQSRGGVCRVLAKLEASIQAGNYYEAHQMYRTLYFRYLTQKRFEDCLDLLFKGSLTFLGSEQFSTGADLAILVVDTLEKRGGAHDIVVWIERLGQLLRLINSTVVERDTLLVRAVKWSSDVSEHKLGHPLMHKMIAQIMWSEGNHEQARHHFLLSRDGVGCGQMLVELSRRKGLKCEMDLFVAQVVFQQLCLKEKVTAESTFQTYTKYHPEIARVEPPFQLPLLNFLFFLLKAIDRQTTCKLATFQTLCDVYKVALARDPSFEKYLQKIGVQFFGAPPVRQSGGGGMFGDLIQQLFTSLDGEDGDEDGAPDRQRSGTTYAELD